jgi:hypothetical protein
LLILHVLLVPLKEQILDLRCILLTHTASLQWMLSRVIFYSRLALHVKFLLPILHHRLIIDSSLKKLLLVIEARQLRKGFLWERVHVGIIPHCIALPLIHHVPACIVPIVILLINLLYR